MKRDIMLSLALTKEEKQLLDTKYIESFASGKCKNKSDFIRQALLAACANGNGYHSVNVSQDNKPDNKQEAPAPKSKLAMDFANIDI